MFQRVNKRLPNKGIETFSLSYCGFHAYAESIRDSQIRELKLDLRNNITVMNTTMSQ